MPQPIATPAGEPHDATVDECVNCGGRIARLHIPHGKWRHDNGAVTCPPPPDVNPPAPADPPFEDLLRGGRP